MAEVDKRIIPQEVVEALNNLGLKASRDKWYQLSGDTPCACGIGAYYAGRVQVNKDSKDDDELEKKGWEVQSIVDDEFGSDYRVGFVYGFDGKEFSDVTKSPNPRHKQGFEDGVATFKSVEEAGLIYNG